MSTARRKTVRLRTLVMLLVIMTVVYYIFSSAMGGQMNAMLAEEQSRILELQALARMGREIEVEILNAETDAYVENEARTKYGYMRRGEIRFVITNPEVLYGGILPEGIADGQ